MDRDFPVGPVVKSLCSHCRGCRFNSNLGKIPTCLTMWPTHKKTKKQRKKRIIEETDISEDKYCKATK